MDLAGLDMTAGEFKTHIGTQCGTASSRFGQNIYETCEYCLGAYESQVEHLRDVIESMSGERKLADVISHLENPAMLLEALNALGLDASDIEQASACGETAWHEALEAGYHVAAALAKAAAAIRESIFGEQPDDSEQEAAA